MVAEARAGIPPCTCCHPVAWRVRLVGRHREPRATPADLEAWCRSTLAHDKVPTHWHLVADARPRTATGKLLNREIRELVAVAEPGNR